jgi:4-amino-4-deoxy-L-arabinose transferase-like glycosyltransferase
MTNRTTGLTIAIIFLAISIVVFLLHFLFFRHSFPPINIDEGSFFSPAKSLSHKGIMASDIHKSFLPGSAVYTYWMPPLYILVLGGVFEIFGSTVIIAKLVSLLLTCGSALLLSFFAIERFEKIAAAALFLICPFIIITSAFIRVEALAIFLTVLAMVAVRKGWPVYMLGIIAALGIMTHPLMLACGAGLGVVALRRGIRPLFFFALAFAITIAPYIWYILRDIGLFQEQMTLQFLRKSKAKFLDLKLHYVIQSVPITLLTLFCLYKVKAANELRTFLAAASVLALAVVLKSNEFNYQVYLIPYAIAALVLLMERGNTKIYRLGLPLLVYLFFAVVLVSKGAKYHFRTDAGYDEMTSYLNKNTSWKGKEVYETGAPDVSTHLFMNGQVVERQIPVPMQLPSNWFDKYDYVIEIKDNADQASVSDSTPAQPWEGWKRDSFTTSNGAFTMLLYSEK